MTYRSVGAGTHYAMLIRSDGNIVMVGHPALPAPPPLPAGVEYVQVAGGGSSYFLALRSDGQVVRWSQYLQTHWQAQLPRGQHFVEITQNGQFAYARRSDGTIVNNFGTLHGIPELAPGTSFHSIAGNFDYLMVATIGSRSSYVAVADGCEPNGAPAQLIPSDTPKLGRTMTVRIDRMAANLGALAFGWSRLPTGVDLQGIGMPGCYLHLVPEVIVPVVGTLGWGQVQVTVPSHPAMLGATWFNQAVLLDPAANALGAKLSVAAEAVVGG